MEAIHTHRRHAVQHERPRLGPGRLQLRKQRGGGGDAVPNHCLGLLDLGVARDVPGLLLGHLYVCGRREGMPKGHF